MSRAPRTDPRARPDPAEVVTKALRRAATRLGLAQQDLAAILGVSAATVSRIMGGDRRIPLDSKEEELALYVIRIFRSLDALVGGDEGKARLWLHGENRHLGAAPVELLRSVHGLVHVADYLDALRGKV
jgi:transcriptional regulator with XRE-family HTH domain